VTSDQGRDTEIAQKSGFFQNGTIGRVLTFHSFNSTLPIFQLMPEFYPTLFNVVLT
jgi:hypothetical protein